MTPSFFVSPILQHVGIADQNQQCDDRQSLERARHVLKKNLLSAL